MHIGIDNTHHVMGYTLSVLVVVGSGIVVHHLHLMECQIVATAKAIGITERHPYLIVLVHLAHVAQRLHSSGSIDIDGVGEVVVVEEHDALQQCQCQLLVVMLALQLINIIIQTSENIIRIACSLTHTIELVVGLQTCLALHRRQQPAQRVSRVSMDGQQASQPTANQQKYSSHHIVVRDYSFMFLIRLLSSCGSSHGTP